MSLIRGVLLAGKFRTQHELNGMSHDDQRKTLIVELKNYTNQSGAHFQSLGDATLAGTGAVLVFLRESKIRDDSALKTMSDDDQRNTLIVELRAQTNLPRRVLQGLSNMDLVLLGLGKGRSLARNDGYQVIDRAPREERPTTSGSFLRDVITALEATTMSRYAVATGFIEELESRRFVTRSDSKKLREILAMILSRSATDISIHAKLHDSVRALITEGSDPIAVAIGRALSAGGFAIGRPMPAAPGPLDPAENAVYGAFLGAILGGLLGGPPGVAAGAYLGLIAGVIVGGISDNGPGGGGPDAPSGGGEAGCFVSGTLVATENGLLPIDQIIPGQLVKTFETATKRQAVNRVLKVFQSQQQEIVLLNIQGEEINCTPRHRFRKDGDWVAAECLRAGDTLVALSGRYATIDRITRRVQPQRVFNLSVDQMHDYFVGVSGVLVHNLKKSDPPDPEDDPFDP